MKRLFVIACTIGLMAFSCEKEDLEGSKIGGCAVANPLQDLPWLKAQVEDLEKNSSGISQYFYIMQAEYKGETVFYIGNCCPMCNTVPPAVLNCKGKKLFLMGQNVKQDNRINNRKAIWKGSNFACNL